MVLLELVPCTEVGLRSMIDCSYSDILISGRQENLQKTKCFRDYFL